MSAVPNSITAARTPAVAVVVSRYNATITDALLAGAIKEYVRQGGPAAGVTVIDAPGSFELPVLCLHAAKTGRYAGVVALGCVIKGDTIHDQVIAHAIAQGLTHASLTTGLPIALGVITANSSQQATDRAGGKKGNKGQEAMSALLAAIVSIEVLRGVGGAAGVARPILHRPDKADRARGPDRKRGRR